MSENMKRMERKQIGAFFTPWWISAEIIRRFQIHKAWAGGASVLDPTAGDGALLEALIRCSLEDGIPVSDKMLKNLKGYERENSFTTCFAERIKKEYRLDVPADCLEVQDFLELESRPFDILLGNPPWLNFTDLPDDEKEKIKPCFKKYGLTARGKNILLGNSRVDLAALVIRKALQDHLNPGGVGAFFIPLSLIFNEGAHNIFRKGILTDDIYSFSSIMDFKGYPVFKGVSTRCGFTLIQKSLSQKEKIPFLSLVKPGEWLQEQCAPVAGSGTAFAIMDGNQAPPRIRMPVSAKPRQGINTGGRNKLFIFNSAEKHSEGLLLLRNKENQVLLPEQLVFPLLSSGQFRGKEEPSHYVFLPYNANGKAMSRDELSCYPEALNYLDGHADSLRSRKGSILAAAMKRLPWILLGVGPYSFAPWKVVWEAFGRGEFRPRLFSQYEGKPWIPNQALQASCSFEDEDTAKRVLHELEDSGIARILKQQNMKGTCNWAQPGRMRHFMDFEAD